MMRKVVDKGTMDGTKVNIVKITNRRGQLDRFNIEPAGKPGVLACAFSLQEAREKIGREIYHPVRKQPTKAECLAQNLALKVGKKNKK